LVSTEAKMTGLNAHVPSDLQAQINKRIRRAFIQMFIQKRLQRECCEAVTWQKAYRHWEKIQRRGFIPDINTFQAMIQKCLGDRQLDDDNAAPPSRTTEGHLNQQRRGLARQLLIAVEQHGLRSSIQSRELCLQVLWEELDSLIVAHADAENFQMCGQFVVEARRQKVGLCPGSCISVLETCRRKAQWQLASQVLQVMWEIGPPPDYIAYDIVVGTLEESNQTELAALVLDASQLHLDLGILPRS